MAKIKGSEPTGGNALKSYREANGLTQQEIADRISTRKKPVSRALVSMWEIGIRDIQAEDAVLLEAKFGIPRERFRPDLFLPRAA